MKRPASLALMPPAPAEWTVAQFMFATGKTYDAARIAIALLVKSGHVMVIRRGNMHGVAIYSKTAASLPNRERVVIRTPAANSVFNIAA